jgi:hypothetical protein
VLINDGLYFYLAILSGIRTNRMENLRWHLYTSCSCDYVFCKIKYKVPGAFRCDYETTRGYHFFLFMKHIEDYCPYLWFCCISHLPNYLHLSVLNLLSIYPCQVCKNGSFHLRGNVYVQYKSLDSALLAYKSVNGRYFAGKQVLHFFVLFVPDEYLECCQYDRMNFMKA